MVDDEKQETDRLADFLIALDHRVEAYNQSEVFAKALRRESFDLVVVDWQMPGMSGIEILKWIRQGLKLSVPVIFVTNMASEASVMEGLDNGADDYLVKPVRRGEFASRVAAALRRANPALSSQNEREVYGGFDFNPTASAVTVQGAVISLTPKELELSLLLFRNLDKALSRAHIQQAVWGNDIMTTRSMDAHLSRLRNKLGLNAAKSEFHLMPIYNFGYRLVKSS